MTLWAKINESAGSLSFLSQTLWQSDGTYRWLEDGDIEPVYKTVAELNEMGYWPVEISNPPDTENRYIPVWGIDTDTIRVSAWSRLPPSADYIAQAASLSFVKQAENNEYDDTTLFEHKLLFNVWHEGWTGKQNQIVQESVDGTVRLYRSRHDVLTPAQNTRPSETPSMWQEIGDPTEEYPQWSQPLGAGDEYALGAKVSYDGKRWVSVVPSNVWIPDGFGWEEIVEY